MHPEKNRAAARAGILALLLLASGSAQATTLNFADFVGAAGNFSLNGNAKVAGGELVLTDDAYQTSSAWLTPWLALNTGFDVSFSMVMSDPKGHPTDRSDLDNPGADGIAFVIQANNGQQLGIGNSGMGYMYIPNSMAVEFDVWQNDPVEYGGAIETRQHIAVQSMGTLANRAEHVPVLTELGTMRNSYLGGANLPQGAYDMKSGKPVNVRVNYIPGTLSIFLTDVDAATPVVSVALDLGTLLNLQEGTSALIGFTASGSGAWQKQAITSLSFTNVPEPSTFAIALVTLVALSRLYRRAANQ
jgi:hypothetical protein